MRSRFSYPIPQQTTLVAFVDPMTTFVSAGSYKTFHLRCVYTWLSFVRVFILVFEGRTWFRDKFCEYNATFDCHNLSWKYLLLMKKFLCLCRDSRFELQYVSFRPWCASGYQSDSKNWKLLLSESQRIKNIYVSLLFQDSFMRKQPIWPLYIISNQISDVNTASNIFHLHCISHVKKTNKCRKKCTQSKLQWTYPSTWPNYHWCQQRIVVWLGPIRWVKIHCNSTATDLDPRTWTFLRWHSLYMWLVHVHDILYQ